MLQKPKTKFGYARRILALPVLFTVAFAYLVNAKNREIEETNLSIKKAVSEIKKDTVRPEKSVQGNITGLKSVSPEDHTKLTELEKKIKEKEKELDGLDPESDAFSDKIEEISNLASEIGEMASKVEVDEYFNSAEWKNQMKELENMDPLDKKALRKLERAAKKAGRAAEKAVSHIVPPAPPSEPAEPQSPKAPKVVYFKNNNTVYYKDLGPKEKEEVRKAMAEAKKAMKEAAKARVEGEKARIEGEKARLEGDRARAESAVFLIKGEKARIEGDRIRKESEKIRVEAEKAAQSFRAGNFTMTTSAPNVMVMHADFIKKDGNGNIAMNGVKKFSINGNDDHKYKYYIDGREVSKDDVNALSSANISKVMVNTQKNGEVKNGEVRIETKK
jgi:hypothetical protein